MADLSSDIVILGAGVLGLAVAAELTGRGHAVLVIDPGDPNASSVAAGMIAPAFESLLDRADRARSALLREAAALWPAFARDHGLSLDPTPALWRGPDAEGTAARLGALGFRADVDAEGVSAPDDVRTDPQDSLAVLTAALGDRRVATTATSVEPWSGGWRVWTRLGSVTGRVVVLATGAASPPPGLPGAAVRSTAVVRPVAGQIGRVGARLTDRVVRGPDGYVAPAGDGVLIGATMVEGQSPAVVDSAASARLTAMAETLLGRPIETRIDWRAAVRGAAPDGLPLAGPTEEDVHLALAPRRNGWLLAPLVARGVADGIEGRPRGTAAAALDPLRFSRPEG